MKTSNLVTVDEIKKYNDKEAIIFMSNTIAFSVNKNKNGWAAFGTDKNGNQWESDDFDTLEKVGEYLEHWFNES